MINDIELTIAEYFAGIGLVRMGLEQADWRVVFANDIEKGKYEMYEAFFEDTKQHYVIEDIFQLIPEKIPVTLLATCSFPCIDLSLAGNMIGVNGKYSSAYWGFINILKRQGGLAPPLILIENVPGWLYSNNGHDFRLTVKALSDLGYSCDIFLLDARRFVPQSRLRVFLVGSRYRRSIDDISPLLSRPQSLSNNRLRAAILENKDLDWTYSELPEPGALLSEGLTELVEKLPDNDERWWSVAEVERHLVMMAESHRKRVESLRLADAFTYRTFYRRVRRGKQRAEVRKDDIAGCLRTALGGSSRQFVLKAGLGEVKMRTMTPREYARLQGVHDSSRIGAAGNQALTGFGDAVCVPAIAWIAKNVLGALVEEAIERGDSMVLERQLRLPVGTA